MGEIKSTLDLVMEKTKHFSLSEDEKRELQTKETRQKINGMLNKFLEQSLSLDQMQKEIKVLNNAIGTSVYHVLTDQIMQNIELDQDNAAYLGLIQNLLVGDALPLENLLNEYNMLTLQLKEKAGSTALTNLENQGIYGLAVIPNLDKDDTWKKESQNIRLQFDSKLQFEKNKLKQTILIET